MIDNMGNESDSLCCVDCGLQGRNRLVWVLCSFVLLVAVPNLGASDDIDTENNNKGKTPLMQAAQRADLPAVRALMKAGAEVNARNKTGGTALMYAALSGDASTVRLLLQNGADINAAATNGWTALMIAAVEDYESVVQALVESGADVNQVDVYGWTPLMRAIYEQRGSAAKALLAVPALKINAQNEYGATALHYAATVGDVDLVRLLLKRGANVRARDTAGHTPAMRATENGHPELLTLLKSAGK
jgi:ankyrin repeat protein